MGAFASCSYARVNEEGVRSQAALQLDCEPELLKLENVDGPGSGVARYEVRGCGKTTTVDCTEDKSQVHCVHVAASRGSTENGSGDVARPVAGALAGCACGSLFGRSRHTTETPSSSPSPESTTPQRNKR